MALSLWSKSLRLNTVKHGVRSSKKHVMLASRAYSTDPSTLIKTPKNKKVADILERLRKIEEKVAKESLLEKDAIDATIILKPDSPAEVEKLGEEHLSRSLAEQYELRLSKCLNIFF